MKQVFSRISIPDINPNSWDPSTRRISFPAHLGSILNDGVLPVAVITLITLLFSLLVEPVKIVFGTSGILVYSLLILAIGVYCLDRSIQMRYAETTRGWFGIFAGLSLWFVVDMVAILGNYSTPLAALAPLEVNIFLMILISLVIGTVWKPILPLGLKFFITVFLMNWIVRVVFVGQIFLAGLVRLPGMSFPFTGFLGLVGVVYFLVKIFSHRQTKVHRMWSAIGAWAFILLLIMSGLNRFI